MNKPIIMPFDGKSPVVSPLAYVAPGAALIGDIEIGEDTSIWFGVVIRADINAVRIGKRVSIQDGSILHVNFGDAAVIVGDDVTVGHQVVLHGCRLESGCLVGIGARVLDYVVVGSGSIVAAGSVVREHTKIPPGELWAGVPAVKKRELSADEREGLIAHAAGYVKLCRAFREVA